MPPPLLHQVLGSCNLLGCNRLAWRKTQEFLQQPTVIENTKASTNFVGVEKAAAEGEGLRGGHAVVEGDERWPQRVRMERRVMFQILAT